MYTYIERIYEVLMEGDAIYYYFDILILCLNTFYNNNNKKETIEFISINNKIETSY